MPPAARRLGPYLDTRPDGYFAAGSVAAFARGPLGHSRGKAVVVWGGGGGHKGPAIRGRRRRGERLTPGRLPAHAPDPNPVEAVWSRRRYGQPASRVPGGIPGPDDEALERPTESECDPALPRARWGGADLPFPGKGRPTQGSRPAGQ